MFSIIVFILILSILVLIHEFGHFIMAKRAGIAVEEFGFGLPPRAWGKKIAETIYSINWLPFGGFVKLVGEDPTEERKNQANSYYTKSLTQRISVVVAGVFLNFLLAVLIFYIVLFALGFKVSLPLYFDHHFQFVNQSKQVLVTQVNADSPAQKASLQVGDSILQINSQKISSIDQLQKIIRSSQDQTLTLILENPVNNQTREVKATPIFSPDLRAPALGIGLGELAVLRYETLPQKLFAGFAHSYNTLDYSITAFGQLIGYSLRQRDITPVSENISGPVGIAQITSQAVALGPIAVLQLAGLLSLNLAFINLLPIPAVDGGRFFFLVIEAITRRRIYPSVEKWIHTIGFAFLLGLIFLITYNDIIKLLR